LPEQDRILSSGQDRILWSGQDRILSSGQDRILSSGQDRIRLWIGSPLDWIASGLDRLWIGFAFGQDKALAPGALLAPARCAPSGSTLNPTHRGLLCIAVSPQQISTAGKLSPLCCIVKLAFSQRT
jgi:hypothetical protein